ncbi:hypothetical protein [Vibrio litoralis]|uniref:hypothetical protein n=1 Tax=Vibrio litoralis TaxID=335972 RepID=UPI001D05793A|nr:hypothetical protein [Vibrio litoralis]
MKFFMHPINFQPEIHAQLTELVSGIKKGNKHPFVTFNITEDALYIIGGETESLMMVKQTREQDCPLEKGMFSYSATAFANLWHGQQTLINEKKTISLQFRHDDQQDGVLLEGRTEMNSFRYALAQPACDHHLTFFNKVFTSPNETIDTKHVREICGVAGECAPFSIFEVSKDNNTVQFERDNDIIPIELPEGMKIGVNLAITPEAKRSLEVLAQNTKNKTISIYTDDDQVIFSDGQTVKSHDLGSLRAYREKQRQNFEAIAKMIVNIFEFKSERDNFQKIEEIKKANQALLYITQDSMYFASFTPQAGALMKLTTSSITTSQEQLYSVNLNALAKIKIKNITTAKQFKMTVLRNTQGELKLGFHNDRDKEYSYDSVPLEHAQSLLPELKHIIETSELDSNANEQNDLFGYDDV